jgi:hypothetical protein
MDAAQQAAQQALEAEVLSLKKQLAEKATAEQAVGDFEPIEVKHGAKTFLFPYPTVTVEIAGKMETFDVKKIKSEKAALDKLAELNAFVKEA